MKKIIALLLAVITFICSMSVIAYAAASNDDLVAPCYNNTLTANLIFSINSSGKATVTVHCTGVSGVTTKIVAETKIQKKFGIIWINVSGANWTDTVNGTAFSKTHTHQFEDNGTYRAKTTITVSGSGGANDVIKKTIEKTY